MSNTVSYLPAGCNTLTPCIFVHDAAKAIDFYKEIFKATELMRFETPNKKIAYAELMIGDSKIMLGDEFPEMNAKSPKAYGGSPIGLYLYVKEVDEVVAQAIQAGAKLVHDVQDKFYGDRSGTIEDPFGHQWTIATHVEDVTEEEISKRAQALFNPK